MHFQVGSLCQLEVPVIELSSLVAKMLSVLHGATELLTYSCRTPEVLLRYSSHTPSWLFLRNSWGCFELQRPLCCCARKYIR